MPLLDAIRKTIAQSKARFHTPGHKVRPKDCIHEAVLGLLGDRPFAADLTELPGLDNLSAPTEVLRQTERLCARIFGAKESIILTCGASSGVVAAILAACHPGSIILVPRECHRSVLSGVVLSGAEPVFYPSQVVHFHDLPAGVPVADLCELIRSIRPTALLLSNPNYFGVCRDLRKAVALARELGIVTIADEAHGAHLPFVRPEASAISWGADIVIHGAHKTLSVLTQGAIVHFSGDLNMASRFRDSLRLVHTTSPSYIILASIEGMAAHLQSRGGEKLRRLAALAVELKSRLQTDERIRIFPTGVELEPDSWVDPFKITLAWVGIDARSAERELITAYGVYPELVCGNDMLFLLGEGDGQETLQLLENSIREVASRYKARGATGKPLIWTRFLQEPWPERLMNPREAFFKKREWVSIQHATGRVCAEPVLLYPPGIPLIWPGEAFTAELCSFLSEAAEAGWSMIGLDESRCVEVCTEG
ncbi:MAG TPA: aminotransferase class I/II-fold pyridoxal phosphate-dependent enzyme [Firmicutes bacterium]|nr:aminotransferase class I/II-fold pyridoxal phosphate-dependent enzyme [Bacillota bacterium]